MNTNKLIQIILAVLALTFLSANVQAQDKKADRDNFTMQVDGLGCPFYAYGLEKKFKKFKGLKI
ncbi:MAG: mercuric ion binding protein [Saprospiraceae bacterium]|jgi:mercuric ion binding protein